MLRVTLQAMRRRGLAGSGSAVPAAQRRMCTDGDEEADEAALPFSRELLRCRTTKEFTSYALRRGAVITRQKGTHATLTGPNGVTYTMVQTSQKDLWDSARKVTFKVFDRMGIARDTRPRRGNEQGAKWSAAADGQQPAGPKA